MDNPQFTLLVADDEVMILRGLAENIPWDTIGVRVVAQETDGLSALKALETHRPDIAIVDICMPLCDGLTMIEKACEKGLDTAFIILSGYDDFHYAQRAIRCNVAAYLLKPINKQELMDAVAEQCLKRASAQGQAEKRVPPSARLYGDPDTLLSRIIGDVAFGRLHDEKELAALLSEFPSALPMQGACVLLVDAPQASHEAILKLRKELFFSCPQVVFAQEPSLLYIAAHIAPSVGAMESLKKLLREFVAQLRAEGCSLSVSMGTYVDTLMQLPLSLRDARDAQQYRLYELPDGIYSAADIDRAPPSDGAYKWDTSELIQAILMMDEAAIACQLDDFMQSLFYTAMPPPSFVIGMCTYMLMDVQRRLTPYKEVDISPIENVHSQLHDQPFLSVLRQWLYTTLLGFSREIFAGTAGYKYAPVIDEAKAFIEENLLKKLFLRDVAIHVHLSESYLAALFKRYTGKSFREYLLNRKMEVARTFLLKEHKSISQVADMLGYEDYRAFTRAFKSMTGIQPSKLYKHPKDGGQEGE